MANVPLTLSATKPDFEALVMQLQLFLNSKATWSDLLTSSTGETLIEMMAAVGTFNQFAIEVAAREGFLHTAVRESSIYAITRMLGVRIARKVPAGTDVELVREGDTKYPYLIPKFTQFVLNGTPVFNRHPIIFNAGKAAAEPAKLYEGTIKVQTIPADSTAFKEIYLNEPGFVVSNFDVEVALVNPTTNQSEVWSVIDEGIWTANAQDKVYYDATSGLGDVVLAFGDGYSGKLPAVGNNIVITYAVTTGTVGNNGGAGLEIECPSLPKIKGKNLSQISGGADEKAPSYYKSTASHLYKARSRAVTPMDYKAIVSSYPGVASVTIQAQKDVAPRDLRWMNVIRVCILPGVGDAFTATEWDTFESWFQRRYHAAVKIQRYNPEKLIRDVEIILYLLPEAVPEEIVPKVEENIRALFARDVNTLGRRIAVSDIVDVARIETVDYVQVKTPLEDFVTDDGKGNANPLQYFELGNLTIGSRYTERALSAARRLT